MLDRSARIRPITQAWLAALSLKSGAVPRSANECWSDFAERTTEHVEKTMLGTSCRLRRTTVPMVIGTATGCANVGPRGWKLGDVEHN